MTTPRQNPIITLTGVKKSFGSVAALRGIDMVVNEGEFFSILGPSGCGKTTLLRLISGFDHPTSGSIEIDGKPMQGIPANRRPTNMVFQNYAIFPHLSVFDNVGYGLKARKMPKDKIKVEVDKALAMVDLDGYGGRAAHELSGGQRQRVALARALVLRPKVILLDEPLSALDKKLREQMQVELRELQQSIGITFVLITHDQEEAMIMSDRIAVMFEGEIAQLASPQQLYRRPENRRVASFIGVMNFLDAKVTGRSKTHLSLDIAALGTCEVPLENVSDRVIDANVTSVGVRPEMFTLLFDGDDHAERHTAGEVVSSSYYGDMTYYGVKLTGVEQPVTISMRNTAGRTIAPVGSRMSVGWGTDSIILFE